MTEHYFSYRTLCVGCGPSVETDEDGRCIHCGAIATGPFAQKYHELEEAIRDDDARLENALATVRGEALESGVGIAQSVVDRWRSGGSLGDTIEALKDWVAYSSELLPALGADRG